MYNVVYKYVDQNTSVCKIYKIKMIFKSKNS